MTPPEVRVRIAPSPTGYLHVGTARTALFNYLFAKGHQGKFILRIEDTDTQRSKAEFTRNIYESLKALGLQWDEGPDVGGPYGPYAQSERLHIYREWAQKLIDSDQAYYCYHTQEELDAEREQAQADGAQHYVYSGKCRDAKTREELSKDPARKPSLRFKIPENRGIITFKDHVRGEVSIDSRQTGDFVMIKSDGTASYNFAVVVDDILMRISHVIRGEDHISNTPRQIMLYEAFQASTPEFAHVSMILAPDRSKLSKRYGAVAVSDYIRQGYLPEAFCNFLALLGWSPPDEEEIGTLEHFASQFELDRITQSPAIFDKDKLNHLNGKWLRSLPPAELMERARPYLHAVDLGMYPPDKLHMMLSAVRERLTLLSELPEHVDYFFGQNVILDAKLVGEVLTGPEPAQVLHQFQQQFLASADFSAPEALSAALKEFTQALQPIKTKTIMWTLRAALTGRTQGIDMGQTLYILGKDVVTNRTETALVLTTGAVS